MSAAPPRQIGPREACIKQVWDDVWREYSQGGVFEPYIAIAEANLANFASTLPANDKAAADDLAGAQNLHLFQSKHFGSHVGTLEGLREQLGKLTEWTQDQLAKYDEHSVRSLTTANGGVVLATLAYIQAQKAVATGFLWVIGLGAAGYILTLLGSHAIVVLSSKPLVFLWSLQQPRLSESKRNSNLKEFKRLSRRMVWWSRPIFYAAAVCLVAALWIGVNTLVQSRPVITTTQNQVPDTIPHPKIGPIKNKP